MDQGIGFISTYVQNDYIWDSYAGAIIGNGWGIDVYENGNGWKVGLLPEAFSGVDSPGLSHVAHTFQNDYGNQWVWIGALITPS